MKKKIEVEIYVDKQGAPTCASNFETGEVCIFYRTTKFGAIETCSFADNSGRYASPLERKNNGEGSLIPGKFCKVWMPDVEKN
jgi:hypothetical protein